MEERVRGRSTKIMTLNMQEGRGAQGPAAEGDRDSRDGRDPRACRHRCG